MRRGRYMDTSSACPANWQGNIDLGKEGRKVHFFPRSTKQAISSSEVWVLKERAFKLASDSGLCCIHFFPLQKIDYCWAVVWYKPLILGGRFRQSSESEASGLHSKFQEKRGFGNRNKTPKQTNKQKRKWILFSNIVLLQFFLVLLLLIPPPAPHLIQIHFLSVSEKNRLLRDNKIQQNEI